MNLKELTWTREPEDYKIYEDKIEITTKPHTDLCKGPIIIFRMTMHRSYR